MALTETLAPFLDRADGPFLVAIDGRSGTGKSTLAEALARRLDAALIPGDDFYAGGTEIHRRTPEALADICIDRAQLRSVLQALKSNRPTRYAAFDWEAFDGTLAAQETTIEPRAVLMVEGVYAAHPDLRDLVDFAILLRTSKAERDRRLLEREGTLTEWERQWHRAEDWYFDTLARPESFDTVIKNE